MADETKDPEKNFRTIRGHKGTVNIILSKKGGGGGPEGEGSGPEEGSEGQHDKTGGYIPPTHLPDDEIIPAQRPYLYFYDLGTELLPAGQASYVERKGLLPIPWLENYSEADYKAWQDEMLGALLGEGHEDEPDPTKTSPIASSPKRRKAPNVWPYNLPAMGNLPPSILLRLKAGATNPGSWSAGSARQVTITDEDWAPINTAEDLAPDSTYWKVKGHDRYDGVGMLDGRYQQFFTYTNDCKVTDEPFFGAPAVEFKIGWPLKVYGVPRLLHPQEGSGISTITGGAQYRESIVTERGTFSTGARYYWLQTTTARSEIYTLGIPFNHWGENGQHSLARVPLFPQPTRSMVELPSAEYLLGQMPSSAYRTYRIYHFRLQRSGGVVRERVIPGVGVSPRITVSSYGPTVRAVTNRGEPDLRDAEEFIGRRPLPLPEIEALALAQIKSEISLDMGRSFDSIPGTRVSGIQPNGDSPDYSYSGTAQIRWNGSVSPPAYDFFAVGLPRSGYLLGLVVCKSKVYYVWKV